MTDETQPAVHVRRVLVGTGMMAFGALWILGRLGWLDFDLFWRLAPLWLVALGVMRVAVPPHERRGGWLILVGLLLLGESLNILPMSESWPVFVIAGGASLLMAERRGRGQVRHEQ
jgi:hypothetical protein